MLEGTILACATPRGKAARGVLRLSGADAVAAVGRISASSAALEDCPGYGGVELRLEVDGGAFDAWAVVYRAPRSYTREDVVELHLPASLPVQGMIARALVVQEGVRWAGPGEFTLRAFRSGRLDLAQAEAVAQVISASEEAELKAARRGLSGEFGDAVRLIADNLIETLALLEAGIDFADEELPEISGERLARKIEEVGEAVDGLRRSSSLRMVAPGSFHCVLAGYPNAGKSSLLNSILGRGEALVSELAGTTRDPVRGTSSEDGVDVTWVDLAGCYSGKERGEPAGLDRNMSPETRGAVERLTSLELEHADGVLWLVDASGDIAGSIDAFQALDAKVKLLVFNKVDLLDEAAGNLLASSYPGALLVCALDGTGLRGLRAAVRDLAGADGRPGALGGEPARFLVSSHQESALQLAMEGVERAGEALAADSGLELAAADLRDALRSLEDLVGEVTPDDVLDHVFSSFCIGK